MNVITYASKSVNSDVVWRHVVGLDLNYLIELGKQKQYLVLECIAFLIKRILGMCRIFFS